MKILFLTDNFPPEVNAPASRTYEHCREWVRLGHEITVITGFPNFPQGRIYPGYKNQLIKQELMDGIQVIRVWTYITANEGFLKRTLDYISFALSGFIASLRIPTDIIIATSPQFFTATAGWLSHRIKRTPWIMEVRDLWPESIKTVGAMDDGVVLRLFEKLELKLYQSTKLIVSVTDSFKRVIVSRGISSEKIQVIKNGVDLSQFQKQSKDAELRRLLGIDGKFVIGYLGTHGLAHRLELFAEWASDFDAQKVHFLFVGDGAGKVNLERAVKKYGARNVTLLPPVPKHQVAAHLACVDAVLVPLRKSDLFKTVIPSKIFESAAMGKPILLGVDGESREMVEEAGIGLYFEPENRLAFSQVVKRLINDHQLYETLSHNGGKFARQYERSRLAEQMMSIIQRELENPESE